MVSIPVKVSLSIHVADPLDIKFYFNFNLFAHSIASTTVSRSIKTFSTADILQSYKIAPKNKEQGYI